MAPLFRILQPLLWISSFWPSSCSRFWFFLRSPFLSLLSCLFLCSCASFITEQDRESVRDTVEFEKWVKVKKLKEPMAQAQKTQTKTSLKALKNLEPQALKLKNQKPAPLKKEVSRKKKKVALRKEKKRSKKRRKPHLEDDEGFDGRRPLVEPYEVGEKVILRLSYFGVEAGKFTMEVKPMVKVNGRKSYHFHYRAKSSRLFSLFYSVNDRAETFVDYETLLPHSYAIHVDESKQVAETRTFFNHQELQATMWDHRRKENKPLEKKKIHWALLKYSQNVLSVAYYLRNFRLKQDKKLRVRVGHEGKNLEMTAHVVRRETIHTPLGKLDCWVVKLKFDIDGKFKPTGENYLWLTNNPHKFIVRMESKIKIGWIVGEVEEMTKGGIK